MGSHPGQITRAAASQLGFSRRVHATPLPSLIVLSVGGICLLNANSSDAADAEGWSVERIITATASREASLRGTDVLVTVTSPNQDLTGYDRATNAYGRALAHFYGFPFEEEPSRTRLELPPDFYRCRWQHSAGLRIDTLENASRSSPAITSLCYDGAVWSKFTDPEWLGPDLIIDRFAPAPALAEYLGLGGRIERLEFGHYDPEESAPVALSRKLSTLAQAAVDVNVFEGESTQGRIVTLALKTPHKGPPGKKYVYELYHQAIVSFSPDLAMAPVSLTINMLVKNGDIWTANPQGVEVAITWSDFAKIESGQHQPTRATVTRRANVMLPAADRFLPLLRDGTPVLLNGERTIDIANSVVRTFVLEERRIEFSELTVTPNAPALCKSSLPAGSVIEDRIDGESYRLLKEGDPSNERIRQKIEGEARFERPQPAVAAPQR